MLVTRPAEQGRRFAGAAVARARAAGLAAPRVVLSPLLEIRFRTGPVPAGDVAGLIFTSENAVAAYLAAGGRRGLPAWCVGPRSAAATSAGGLHAVSADGDARALIDRILADRPLGPLLYPHGAERRHDLGAELNSAGIETISSVVYDQEPCPLTPEARAVLNGDAPVVAPLFSPRSAGLFRAAAPLPRAELTTVSISAACDAALGCWSGPRRVIAARPDGKAVIAGVIGAIAGSDA